MKRWFGVLVALIVLVVLVVLVPMCAAPARALAVVEVEVALVGPAVLVAAVGPTPPVLVLSRPHPLAVAVAPRSAAKETVWGQPLCFEIFQRPVFAPSRARAARAAHAVHHCRSPTSLLLHSPYARALVNSSLLCCLCRVDTRYRRPTGTHPAVGSCGHIQYGHATWHSIRLRDRHLNFYHVLQYMYSSKYGVFVPVLVGSLASHQCVYM